MSPSALSALPSTLPCLYLRTCSGAFPGVTSYDDFRSLDMLAAVVGRMVVSAETNFTSVDKWTPEPAFKE